MTDLKQGTHCNFAGGKCVFNNTETCAKKSVLHHCYVLREYYSEGKHDALQPDAHADSHNR